MENQKHLDDSFLLKANDDHQTRWYELPHLPPREEAGRDALVLAMDEVEEHLSRLRFILFLRDIQAQWPKGVAALGIQYDASSPDAPIWRIRCWRKTRKPTPEDSFPGSPSVPADPIVPGLAPIPTPSAFSRFITGHGIQDDEGFARLAFLHLADRPLPLSQEQLAALELDVLDPSVRSSILAAKADQELPSASSARPHGPGRL